MGQLYLGISQFLSCVGPFLVASSSSQLLIMLKYMRKASWKIEVVFLLGVGGSPWMITQPHGSGVWWKLALVELVCGGGAWVGESE